MAWLWDSHFGGTAPPDDPEEAWQLALRKADRDLRVSDGTCHLPGWLRPVLGIDPPDVAISHAAASLEELRRILQRAEPHAHGRPQAGEPASERAMRDEEDANRYPYLTCELGGGMMNSYHRRILIQPEDIESVALVKVGSGGNLPGYYMYHGGVNPEGRLTTLMEAQATPMTNYNDMPVKNYDFQAPLGSFGQTRGHYHRLRRMHLLFRDFGRQIAPMDSFLPAKKPGGGEDLATLRWAVRSDGEGGFLFVNNHQRGATLPAHEGVSFSISTPGAGLLVPDEPVTVPSGARFIWPFGMDLGGGLGLVSATAQLVCRIDEDEARTLFFAETPGVPATFKFADGKRRTLDAGREVALRLAGAGRELRVVLLSEPDSLALWKGNLAGRPRVVLSRADVAFDRGEVELRSEDPESLEALVYPPLPESEERDGIFGRLPLGSASARPLEVAIEKLRDAGEPREIRTGRQKVAVAPSDEDFADAAAWTVKLPEGFDPAASDALLRIRYRGDVARVRIGDQLVMDDFFNGRPLEVGLRRHAEALREAGGLTLEILPFQADAPIFLPEKPASGTLLSLESVTLVPRYRARPSGSK